MRGAGAEEGMVMDRLVWMNERRMSARQTEVGWK